ncbi:SusC/RagA family TonB-linked outer membrane protein [uncultured Alistipes sp.]|jgi:tonB-linked outer membrane protein, susC/ragA family|uniref:SusC/RagA family TonB-linked outer membrane protein n=1 Tax=uncultured Alistipes sp. TaxID=538949 RepID=UPI0025E72EC9|nr:SusC/RagA family TonB-linked outer membrane protein [uncultured Alistipes sp.]
MKYIVFILSKYAALLFSALLILTAGASGASAQPRKTKPAKVDVSVTIVDSGGEVVPHAEVTVGEGLLHLTADEHGRVSFAAQPRDMVSVQKPGYKANHVLAAALVESDNITLSPEILLASDDDDIPLPYTSIKKRYSVGSTIVIKGEELEKYASTDIRNALTAIAAGVEVTERFGGPGVNPLEHIGQYGASVRVGVTSRGRQMMYMVDDIPVQIDETPLDPQQVESITIVRDVLEKTLYGPSAANGIVYIKTKRGQYNNRYLNVEVEGGVNTVDRMPDYVNGADYARLNNIARDNSGMSMLYSREDVAEYALNNPNDKFYPNVDFRKMMLKNTMYYTKANVSSGGGNDMLRYFAFLGYAGEDDIYKIGPGANYNRVNINANLDIKLHRYIRARFGLISTMGVRKSSNYGYSPNYSSEDASSNTTLGVTEFPDIISDINTIPAISFPIYANDDPSLESPWYAISSLYKQNPIANILENGSYSETIRKGLFNVGIDVDLSFLTPGLSSMSYGAYDATNLVRLGKAEDYAAYILNKGIDENGYDAMIPEKSSSHSVVEMSKKTKLLDYFSNRFYFVQKFAYERTFGRHAVDASASLMVTKRSQKFITEHRRELTFGFGARYAYDGRYLVQAACSYQGTYALLNNRWSASPSVGLGWIISEENFMKNVRGIDFLKLRAEAGLLYVDGSMSANRDVDNYKWDNSGQKFGPYTSNQWFGSTTSNAVDRLYPQMLGNPNLHFEKRKELSVGIDGVALKRRLNFSMTYYNTLSDGPVSELKNVLPLVAGVSSGALWMNYEKTRYQGYELSLGWRDNVGDFSYSVNGWASVQASKVIRADELDYREAYRSKVGYSASSIWGLRYLGQFRTDEETLLVPQLFDDELKAGDLRYEDMNGDGIIDDNDFCVIGNSTPKLIYGVHVNLRYRNFDLTVTGTGRAFYDIALTNDYYWNGWGDGNYSKYTMQHAGDPNHPRLTYNKVNNNYKTSTFWLADGGFFKIQSLEVGYELPVRRLKLTTLRRMRVYVRGNNLCTFSHIRDLDPEAMSSGLTNYPLMRTFVAGVKLTF